jgi:hypothetical protein
MNGHSLDHEGLIYNKSINDTFQRKFRKQGGREFNVTPSRFA